MVCCVFSLESPHLGDSNEHTQDTIFNIKKENHPKLSQICSYGIYSRGLKNKFETAVVNEPLVFEPLTFYCIKCHFFLVFRTVMVIILDVPFFKNFDETVSRYHHHREYSRTSVAKTPIARLPQLFRTRSGVPNKNPRHFSEIILGGFLFYIENCMLCVLIRIASMRRF